MFELWKQWEGQVLDGRFPLRQYLGGSDHSAVFLTEGADAAPQKAVVKLLALDPETAQRELSRADEAARLSHPRLIRIFHSGQCQIDDQRLVYIVMEYAPEDLSQVLVQRPLTADEAREVSTSVLEGLQYLHRQGFVHGHLKPANILAVDDQVKISADGLRRTGDRSLRTPGVYDPPEADRAPSTAAGDVWTLAMTLVEVLTQRLPVWEGAEKRVVLPQSLPDPFPEIARHCLQEDPRHRWTLRQIAARLTGAGEEPRLSLVQRRLVLPLTAAVLLLAAVMAGLLYRGPAPQQALVSAPEPPKQELVPAILEPTVRKAEKPSPFQSKTSPAPSVVAEAVRETKPAANLVPDTVPTTTPAAAPVPERAAPDASVHQVLPAVPAKARSTIHGKVRVGVQVDVDAAGKVVESRLDSPGTSPYFAQLALEAARSWTFAPAAQGAWILRFEFDRSTTRVQSKRVSP